MEYTTSFGLVATLKIVQTVYRIAKPLVVKRYNSWRAVNEGIAQLAEAEEAYVNGVFAPCEDRLKHYIHDVIDSVREKVGKVSDCPANRELVGRLCRVRTNELECLNSRERFEIAAGASKLYWTNTLYEQALAQKTGVRQFLASSGFL